MKILAIDTSTAVMGIALLDEEKVYSEMTTNVKRNHSIRLMPTIELLFQEVNWSPEEIDLIAVAKGPGSYTGVRIGVTTAKAFAWSLHKPIVGISTLEAMAYQNKEFQGYISPIIDARRGQVYSGLYKNEPQNWQTVVEDRIILLSDWITMIKEKQEPVLFVGDDLKIHSDYIRQNIGNLANQSESFSHFPRASVIGRLAIEEIAQGRSENAYDFVPEYLQLAEAEVKWLENQKQQTN